MSETEQGAAAEPPRDRAHRRVCALFDDAVAEDGARGARDAALISVLFGAGVPPDGAAALPLEAWNPAAGILRWRVGPDESEARRASEGARAAMEAWVQLRGDAPGPLLLRVGEDGEIDEEPLAPADVDRILATRGRIAGVRAGPTEALRRFYDSPWWEDAPPSAPAGGAGRGRGERGPAVEGTP